MAKIICVALYGSLITSNQYTNTKTGNTYLFQRGIPTDVPNKEDEEYFLRTDAFEKVGVKEKVKGKLTGKKPTTAKKHTQEELFALNRRAQVELIRKLGGSNARIPKFEKDRVIMILKLQD